ncbi:MAG: TetR/AcrR family transcriptional regulator [Planctomycetota bacterium]|jgi:AcrR family transcriptional regulator
MKTDIKQSRGQVTRAEIISVARQLFSEHGYNSTGVADIQEAIGLTKGAFYHHFRTKEDLALAVLEVAEADYAEHLIGPAMKLASAGERLAALLDGAAALNCQPEWRNCQLMATLCAEMTPSDERLYNAVAQSVGTFYETWRELIAEGQKTGEVNDSADAAVWAQLIINLMAGSLVARKIGGAQVDMNGVVELIKRILIKNV